MLTMVEIRTSQGDLLGLPFESPTNGFIVEDISGLDPVKATIVSSSFARMDGQQYQSSRREMRNIRLKLNLQPDYVLTTIRDLRKRLYGFFVPKAEINLRFYMTDGATVNISGRVESLETVIFAQEPTVDISILCFDPDFIDPTPIEISGETSTSSTETLISYDGTVETGLQFVLNVDREVTEFTIYHRPPDGTLRTLDFAASLVADDVLTINTVVGSKSAILTRSGSESSVLYGMSPHSSWIELLPGDNYIRVYTEGAAIPFDITHITRYGGL